MVLDSHPTFACPHCGAVYPFRPVLVDRAVRCTKCTKPFKVRADRTVDKVEDSSPVPVPEAANTNKLVRAQQAGKTARVSKPSGTAPAVPKTITPASDALTPKVKTDEPAKPATARVEAKADAKPEAKPDPAKTAGSARLQVDAKKASAKSLNEQQEEMRRQMSASLNAMAGKLAPKEEIHAEPTDAVTVDSPAKAGAKAGTAVSTAGSARHKTAGAGTSARAKTARKTEGDTKNAKIVLTNEGERLYQEERNLWRWVAIVILVPLALALLWWCWPNAKGDAVRRFATPPEGNAEMHRFPLTVMKRGWMVMPQLPLIDAGSFSFTGGSTLPVAGFEAVLSPLHGMVYDPDHGIWTQPGKQDLIAVAFSRSTDRAVQLKFAAAGVGTVIDQTALEADLGKKGLPPEAARILARMATGTGTLSGSPTEEARPLLDDLIAHPPTQLELAPFTGNGTSLTTGLKVERKPTTYHGVLMRVTGPEWPHGWRMWEISAN